MGTPMMALNSNGKKVWSQTLDIFGRNTEKSTNFVPFRYQGQYYDEETGLSYNRFRYYDPKTGNYISQDPIGLAGGNPTIYGHVHDTNGWVDIFGLYNNYPRQSGGRFGKNPNPPAPKAPSMHGNSLDSTRPTIGYKLYSDDGTFLKNGITSEVPPETRYSQDFMKDKYMETTQFPDRRSAYEWEYEQNKQQRGPLNKNMH